jgi:hypothetical protein
MTQQGKATEFHDCREINKHQRNYTIVLYKCINNYDKRSSADYWGVGPDLLLLLGESDSYDIRRRGRRPTPRI